MTRDEGMINLFQLRDNTGKPSHLPMKGKPRACLINLVLFSAFVMFRLAMLQCAGNYG
jgi:hypothetical protein